MLPIPPSKSSALRIEDAASIKIRVAKEQTFYEEYGTDSIVAIFRFIQSAHEISDALATLFDGLFAEKFRGRDAAITGSNRG